MKIKYTGTADFKEYTAADFKKGGIDDGKKVTFERGEVTEVSDSVGEALTAKDGFFGDEFFEKADEDEDEGTGGEVPDAEDQELPWVERLDDDTDQ